MDSLAKRLARMDRWLKRCAVACKCGSWSSALADMECLEAETREFRSELWDRTDAEAHCEPVARRSFCARTLGATALALCMILAVGVPLSMEQPSAADRRSDALVWVSSTESDVLAALRERLSNGNEGRIVLTIDRPDPAPKVADGRSSGAAAAVERTTRMPADAAKAPAPAKPEERQKQEKAAEPSVEEVISLIQIGQRALRTGEPAVRIVH